MRLILRILLCLRDWITIESFFRQTLAKLAKLADSAKRAFFYQTLRTQMHFCVSVYVYVCVCCFRIHVFFSEAGQTTLWRAIHLIWTALRK